MKKKRALALLGARWIFVPRLLCFSIPAMHESISLLVPLPQSDEIWLHRGSNVAMRVAATEARAGVSGPAHLGAEGLPVGSEMHDDLRHLNDVKARPRVRVVGGDAENAIGADDGDTRGAGFVGVELPVAPKHGASVERSPAEVDLGCFFDFLRLDGEGGSFYRQPASMPIFQQKFANFLKRSQIFLQDSAKYKEF